MEKNNFIYLINATEIYKGSFSFLDTKNFVHRILVNNSLDLNYLKTLLLKKESFDSVLINVDFTKGIDNKITKDELRKYFYENGFDVDGKHFVRYKRSAGSSRQGKCLFILEKYYKKMDKWSKCGLKENKYIKKNLVSFEAYKALSLSSLEKIIKIDPKSILVMDDFEIDLTEKAVAVEIENGKLISEEKENVKITNNIWDGQGLLDSSVFVENGFKDKGMMLLRNRFFKCCAFNTNIKQFLLDNKDKWPKNSKLNGYMYDGVKIEDIKLIITKSSLKYIKLCEDTDESIKNWMENVGSSFGVVKTDKPTQLFNGNMVYTSYQFLNSLGLNNEEAQQLVKPFLNYRNLIRNDFDIFRFYVENSSFAHTNETTKEKSIYDSSYNYRSTVCKKLSYLNTDFQFTEEYKTYISNLTTSFRNDSLNGRIMINGTNATLFGNGYEMLLHTIFQFDLQKSILSKDEVYCKKFKNNEFLIGSRSPHITMGNLLLTKNKHLDVIDKYFNLSNEIVLVDAIHNNIQQKLNGCDYDSDFMLLTNNKIIVEAVKRNYSNFLVPVCLVPQEKKINADLYSIDTLISSNKIGQIVNLSQYLNSIYWHLISNGNENKAKEVYLDICKLAVLSGIEIDKAKRFYNVDVSLELSLIKSKIKKINLKKPMFFYYLNKFSPYAISYSKLDDGTIKKENMVHKNDYQYLETGMDYIVKATLEEKLPQTRGSTIPISKLINTFRPGGSVYYFINELIEDIKTLHNKLQNIRSMLRSPGENEEAVIDNCKIEIDELLNKLELKKQLANPLTLYAIINKLELEENFSLRYLILYILLEEKRHVYTQVFINKPPQYKLVETSSETNIQIFDKFYEKVAL